MLPSYSYNQLGRPTHHIRVDMSRPTPMQSTKTTHSSSFRVSRTPISSTRPKPTVDTAEEQRECSVIIAQRQHQHSTGSIRTRSNKPHCTSVPLNVIKQAKKASSPTPKTDRCYHPDLTKVFLLTQLEDYRLTT